MTYELQCELYTNLMRICDIVMKAKRLSRSIRKYIRREKSWIRREFLDIEKQKDLINELYSRFLKTESPTKL